MDAAEAAEIREFLQELSEKYWMKGRRWWPKCAFHFTEIANAAKILADGQLVSRTELAGDEFYDGANPEVIRDTRREAKEYVRLYFGPRTPTQYHTEGIRPPDQRHPSGAHIPRPVYFLFSLPDLAVRDDCYFSDGNMRFPTTTVGQGIDFLRGLDFRKIYHRRAFSPEERDEIINARHTEILFRERLDLTHLYAVLCRSAAERESLLYRLDPATRQQYRSKILVRPDLNLFKRKWVFIESVQWAKPRVFKVKIFGSSETPGPFRMEAEARGNGRRVAWRPDKRLYLTPANDEFRLRLPEGFTPDELDLAIRFDDCTAYENHLEYVTLVE